jgi:hypothetical protein
VGGNESVWDQKEAVLQLSKKKNILDRTWAGLKSKLCRSLPEQESRRESRHENGKTAPRSWCEPESRSQPGTQLCHLSRQPLRIRLTQQLVAPASASQSGSVSSPACPSNRLSVSVWSASLFGLLLYPAMILHHTVLASGVILVAGIRSQYQIIG